MSKPFWRMHSKYNMMYGIQASEPDLTDKANCTLIPDESNFPVKEAMRLCKAYISMQDTALGKIPKVGALFRLQDAEEKYRKAINKRKNT